MRIREGDDDIVASKHRKSTFDHRAQADVVFSRGWSGRSHLVVDNGVNATKAISRARNFAVA